MEEISHNGCINLIGAIINRAIIDYQSKTIKKRQRLHWSSARYFLFSKGRLEEFVEKYGIDDLLDVDYLRKLTETQILNKSKSKTAETLIA